MSTDRPNPNADRVDAERIRRAVHSLLAGEANNEDRQAILQAGTAGGAPLRAYLEAIETHALLAARHESPLVEPADVVAGGDPCDATGECSDAVLELLGYVEHLSRFPGAQDSDGWSTPEPRGASTWLPRSRWLTALVSVAACGVLAFVYGSIFTGDSGPNYVGVVTNAVGAEWTGDGPPQLPARIERGAELALKAGVAEVTLSSGVVVVMRGPADIDVLSPMKVRANRGVVRARVGEEARGFVIETPTTDVIDLGTEFGVDVDDRSGATDVVVFDGSIDLRYVGRNAEAVPNRGRTVAARRQEIGLLRSGDALRVAPSGSTERIVSINSASFPAAAAAPPLFERPPLIRWVTDNLRDPAHHQFYQIVHGGLREDSRVYVDRRHEWNGVDERGIPAFLRGADYVMAFNADKWRSEIQLQVELADAARLYVLWDERVKAPAWLLERFELTDAVIGVDEGFNDNPRMDSVVGRGPGVSIDNRYKVWRTDVAEASVVTLGALPLQDMAVSMYGVAATPLPPRDRRGGADARPRFSLVDAAWDQPVLKGIN